MSDGGDNSNVIKLPMSDQSATRLIALLMRQLNYSEMMKLAADLHSDSEALGKTPTDVAELLSRWCGRQLEARK